MDLGVIEVVASRKKSTLMVLLRVLLIVAAVLLIVLSMMIIGAGSMAAGLIALAAGALAAFGAYAAGLRIQIDYEYSLVDRELRIARIQNKERRKYLGALDLDKMEILAPAGSRYLDDWKSRKAEKLQDYTDGTQNGRYVLWMEGNAEYLLTLEGEEAQTLLSEVKRFAPRKVWL